MTMRIVRRFNRFLHWLRSAKMPGTMNFLRSLETHRSTQPQELASRGLPDQAPPLTDSRSAASTEQVAFACGHRVVEAAAEAMRQSVLQDRAVASSEPPAASIAVAGREERLKLAGDINTSLAVLTQLAQDADSEVARRAIRTIERLRADTIARGEIMRWLKKHQRRAV